MNNLINVFAWGIIEKKENIIKRILKKIKA